MKGFKLLIPMEELRMLKLKLRKEDGGKRYCHESLFTFFVFASYDFNLVDLLEISMFSYVVMIFDLELP